MRIVAVIVSSVLVLATIVVAQPSGPFTPGAVKYRLAGGGAKLYDKPDPACVASAADLTLHGNKQKFVRVKDGPADLAMSCILRGNDNKEWSQDNIIEKKMICADGTESVSTDNSGTWASQGCPCDPATCPPAAGSGSGSGSGSAAPPPPDRCAQFARNPVCTASTAPPGAERSERCTQKPARRGGKLNSKAAVARTSAANRATAAKDRRGALAYGMARKAIEDELMARKEDKTGVVKTRGDVWEKFGPDDMCEGSEGYNDVNIGMLCGTYDGDFAAANNIAGLGATPPGCTWHHHQDRGRMQLVKKTNHNPGQGGPAHTGGLAIWRKVYGIAKTPLCCPDVASPAKP